MFAIGISAMMMQLLFMIQQTILYKMAFKYGGDANGILMAASLRFYGFSFIPLWGMCQGLQPIIGTNFGAKQFDRVREAMRIFSIGGLMLAMVFWVPALVFSEEILSAFGVDGEIISEGVNNFRLFYAVFVLYGIMVMIITLFQAVGDSKKAAMIVLFRQLILFVPLIIILPMLFGLKAVWLTQPLVDLGTILASMVMMVNVLKNLENISAKSLKVK